MIPSCRRHSGRRGVTVEEPAVYETVDRLAMIEAVEYIEFDVESPHAGIENFATAIRRVAEKQ